MEEQIMQYTAFVSRDGDSYLIEFPDCAGCQTFADSARDVDAMATEALEGWLEATLAERRVPPAPTRHKAPLGASALRVSVNPVLAVALQVRWARQARGLSQGALADLVGVSQQAIAKLEDPDANPTLDTIRKVAAALDLKVILTLDSLSTFAHDVTVRSSAQHAKAKIVPLAPRRKGSAARKKAAGKGHAGKRRRIA
jgi:transcriptional regulator with XRE-family HTH domain/predicted RNase H-like HicB family nuclease